MLLAGSVVDVPTAAPLLAVMLGLGAGIDYALFVVTRFRTELATGKPPVQASGRAVATAGHAVVFAGSTVVVAILGLVFAGIPFIATLGLATAITIAVMVVAAVTLLPALLGLLGHRVNRLRLPRAVAGAPSLGSVQAGVGRGGVCTSTAAAWSTPWPAQAAAGAGGAAAVAASGCTR